MKIVVIGLAGLLLAGCAPKSQPPDAETSQVPPSQVPAYPTDPVGRWMECEECDEGERQAVVAMGGAAVQTLAGYLNQGPPAERVAALEQALRGSYARRADTTISEVQWVARYRANYEAKYRIRAAEALGAIGGAEAQRALSGFDTASARSDVREAVRRALGG